MVTEAVRIFSNFKIFSFQASVKKAVQKCTAFYLFKYFSVLYVSLLPYSLNKRPANIKKTVKEISILNQ